MPNENTPPSASVDSIVHWVKTQDAFPGIYETWQLMVRKGKRQRNVATVWDNGGGTATWHTWDRNGVGGENDVEHEDTPKQAVRSSNDRSISVCDFPRLYLNPVNGYHHAVAEKTMSSENGMPATRVHDVVRRPVQSVPMTERTIKHLRCGFTWRRMRCIHTFTRTASVD